MLTRREFIVLLSAPLLAPPTDCFSQAKGKLWRIGFLGDGTAAARAADLRQFMLGLEELGYVPDRNVSIEVRWTEGDKDRRTALAKELAGLNLDVIVTHGVAAALAAKAATTTTPIVVAVAADFITTGLVASLSRPGGNLTGMTDQVTELAAKEVELLKEVFPRLRMAGIIWEPENAAAKQTMQDTFVAAESIGLRLLSYPIRRLEEIDTALDAMAKAGVQAVLMTHTPLSVGNRGHIAQMALKNRLALIVAPIQFAEAGGLLSYGPDLLKYFRRAAVFVDKILKGTRPTEIPVEQPTKFELVVNMKTAKALGVTIPQSILVRADKVIE